MARQRTHKASSERKAIQVAFEIDQDSFIEAINNAMDENFDLDEMVKDKIADHLDQNMDSEIEEYVTNKVEQLMNDPCPEGLAILDKFVKKSMERVRKQQGVGWLRAKLGWA